MAGFKLFVSTSQRPCINSLHASASSQPTWSLGAWQAQTYFCAGLIISLYKHCIALQHPNLPGRSDADTTDKSDAPKGYDPNPDLMFDAHSANKPKDGERKDGEVVDQDNTISSSSDQPRKSPEDVAPEQAGS